MAILIFNFKFLIQTVAYNLDDDIKDMAEASGNLTEDADNKTLAALEAEEKQREIRDEATKTVAEDEGFDEDVELSLRTIIGGDFLKSRMFISQVGFVIYIVILIVVYTWNRYSFQDDTLLEDDLRKELKDVKYNVLTQSSELMNFLRQSNVEQVIKQTPDSILSTSVTAPFLLRQGSAPSNVKVQDSEEDYDINEDGN